MQAFDLLRTDLLVPLISRDEAERSEALLLPAFLTEADIAQLDEAAKGLAEESRGGESVLTSTHYSNTHHAINLHHGGYFAFCWPALCNKIIRGMSCQPGRWCPEDVKLHLRCVEMHTYEIGDGLMTFGHRDYGSALTLSVLLSHEHDLQGGDFMTWREGRSVVHRMARGDAILFHSEKMHNVAPITRGQRRSLVVELWTKSVNLKDRYT